MSNGPRPLRWVASSLAIVILWAGCGSRPDAQRPAPTATSAPADAAPDLETEIARAAALQRPLFVLVAESAKGGADESARGILTAATEGRPATQVIPVVLDLGVSRNRANAARFHALTTPVLLSLSPRGIILRRDEGPLSRALVLQRIDEVGPLAEQVDAQFAALEASVRQDSTDLKARLALADFLQGHQNRREAIPHLAALAHADAADPAVRVRAWVDLARAHLWIAEPEKGRREARALLAEWGPKSSEARAGGNLALALLDARANRVGQASREFEEAIAAAPDSDYARQAREALAQLPKPGG